MEKTPNIQENIIPNTAKKPKMTKEQKNKTPAAIAARKRYYQKNKEYLLAQYKTEYYPKYKERQYGYFINKVKKFLKQQETEKEETDSEKQEKEDKFLPEQNSKF